jgi:hypothetical protein
MDEEKSLAFYDSLRRDFNIYIEDETGKDIRPLSEAQYRDYCTMQLFRFNEYPGPNLTVSLDSDLSALPSPPVNPDRLGIPKQYKWDIQTHYLLHHFPDIFEECQHDSLNNATVFTALTAVLNIQFKGWGGNPLDGEARSIAVGTKILWNRVLFRRNLNIDDVSASSHHSVLMTPYIWAIWQISCTNGHKWPTFHVKPVISICPRSQTSVCEFWVVFHQIVKASWAIEEEVKNDIKSFENGKIAMRRH